MYAVFATGGQQFRVRAGDTLLVDKLPAEEGTTLTFDKVLLIADGEDLTIGRQFIDGATVTAQVLAQGRGPKVLIMKLKRRKNHFKRQGHRQYLTKIQITNINK